MSQIERDELIKEIPSELSLCPNITEFMVKGGTWDSAWLQLDIRWADTSVDYDFDSWTMLY